MDEILKNLIDSLSDSDVNDMFDSIDEKRIIECCKVYLQSKGYNVLAPRNFNYNKIDSIDTLIEVFYLLYDKYHPEDFSPYRNKRIVDRSHAKRFVEARMAVNGLDKEHTLNECAEIIITIFEFEKEFGFDRPLTFSILGQDKVGWITEKAIHIMNRKYKRLVDEENKKTQDRLDNKYNNEPEEKIAYDNLDDLLNNFKDDILNKYVKETINGPKIN